VTALQNYPGWGRFGRGCELAVLLVFYFFGHERTSIASSTTNTFANSFINAQRPRQATNNQSDGQSFYVP
jgi:hypothetical protein